MGAIKKTKAKTLKLLIVDDDPAIRDIFKSIVKIKGHAALEACDGAEGLEIASNHKLDAIISDILMPRMDGFQFLKAIKQSKSLNSIPFIFFSAVYTDIKEQELAISLGAAAFILKPKRPDDLWDEINIIIKKASAKKPRVKKKGLIKDKEFLENYSQIVASKLESKVKELEDTKKTIELVAEEWEKTFDSVKPIIMLLDTDFRIKRINKSAEEFLGMSFRKIIGKNCFQLFHKTEEPIEQCPLQRMKQTKKHEEAEMYLPEKNIWVLSTVDPILDNKGNISEIVHIIYNITERKQAEDATKVALTIAQNEKAKWEATISAIGDGISIQDTNFRIIYQNQSAINMIGDQVGKYCYEAYEKRDARCSGCPMAMTFEDGDVHKAERSAPTDKGIVQVEITTSSIKDASGKIIAGVEVIRDITERKKQEDAVKHGLAQQKAILDNIPDIAWLKDKESRFIAVNEPFGKACGVSLEELIGKTDLDIWHKDLAERYITDDREVMSSGKRKVIEEPLKYTSGEISWIETIKTPIYDEKGEVIGTTGIARDITKRKQYQEELKASEEKFRALFENANDAIFILDMDGNFADINRIAYERLGYSKEEILSMHVSEIDSPEFAERVPERIEEININGRAVFESAHLRKDGSVMPVEINARVIAFGGRNVLFSIVRDITERKKAEDELQEYNDLLNAINQAQTQFISESDPRVLFDSMLENTLFLTKSEYGFIGEILYKPDGQPYLKTYAVTNIAWNEETKKFYDEHVVSGMEFHNMNTLFGKVITGGEPVISNEPYSDQRSGGLPEGHPKLNAFLGIPFFSGNKLVGMAGIANRPGGYDESLVMYLQPYLNTCSNIIEAYRNDQKRKQAEENIFRIKQDWEFTFNSITDMVTVHDKDYNIILANKAAQKILGLPFLEKVSDTKCFRYYHGTEKAPEGCPSCQCLQTGVSASFEIFEPHLNMFIEIRAIPRFDSNDHLIGLIHVVRDITARKKAESVLKEEMQKAQTYLDIAGVMMAALDEEGRIMLINKKGCEISGHDESEIIGKNWFELCVPAHVREEVKGIFNELMAGNVEEAEYYENPVVTKKGEERIIAFHNTVLRNNNGDITGVLFSGEDITERKRNEDSLKKYSQELTALNTASNTLILTTNLDDIYQEICNIIYSVFELKMVWLGIIEEVSFEVKPVAHAGYEEGYLSNIKITWDDMPTGKGPTGMSIKTKKPFMVNINDPVFKPWKEEADKRGYLVSMAVPLIYARDKCIGVLNFYSNDSNYFTPDRIHLLQIFANQAAIAIENARLVEGLEEKVVGRTRELEDAVREQMFLNIELEHRKTEAESANRAKSDFLANMSHELRTPLNAILGFAELVNEGIAGSLTDQQKEFLGDILRSGNHLLNLINDILDLSKVESGKMELEMSEIDIRDIINSSLLIVREKAMKHNIKIKTEIEEGVVNITADERKIKQVIFNLLSNAMKFTPDGGSVIVNARNVRGEELRVKSEELASHLTPYTLPNRDFIEISVSDTGIGISKEDQKKLFQPFQQLETSYTKKYAGTGLGLSMCMKLVELHDGMIWVESESAKGSKFIFAIPTKK